MANKLILTKIRDALGLTRCDLHLSGAAPINPEILKYFYSLNIVVTEVYGMSECSGPHAMAVERQDVTMFRLGSCGKTIVGASTRLSNPDVDGNGEVCMGGRHVLMGYLEQLEKTTAAIDDGGWLHSEDIGKIDSDGFLYITGRLKELLITAGGENVAPVPIEDTVKTALPFVSQAVLLGDRLKFLSILLTLKVLKATISNLNMKILNYICLL
jgi:long-chain-fatty-acid--CoA ligase ACSBG